MADDLPAARRRAEESIAARFTRMMNATTSRFGMLSDPPIVAIATAPLVLALLGAVELSAGPLVLNLLEALAALPLLGAVLVSLALRGARAQVVDWLAGLPFPVENLNAVLNGLGDSLEVTFAERPPSTSELNAALDQVSADAFVTRAPDLADAEASRAALPDGTIEIRIGVVDSSRNPAATNHQRFERVRALVSAVLSPIHARFPVVEVRVK